MGIVALQIACVGWALGSALSRRHARKENVLSAAAMQMLFGGLFMLAAATVRGESSHLAFTPRTLLAEIYLTLVRIDRRIFGIHLRASISANRDGLALCLRQSGHRDGAWSDGRERTLRAARRRRIADGTDGFSSRAVEGPRCLEA